MSFVFEHMFDRQEHFSILFKNISFISTDHMDDPYEQRVIRINKEIERTLFVNLALEAQVKSVQERVERVRRDRQMLLEKIQSHESEPIKVEPTSLPSKPIESGRRSLSGSSKSEKVVKKKRTKK